MDPHFNKFQTKRKNRSLRIRAYLAFAGLFLLLSGIFYAVQLSPIFQIRNFNVSGKEHLSDEEVLKILEPLVLNSKTKNFLGKNNILSWNIGRPDTSKTALLEALIDRDWIRQSVDISVKERERLAIWCSSNSNCSWIDNDGMLFEKAPQVEGSLIMTVLDMHSESILYGGKISEERFIGNIVKILESIKKLRIATEEIRFDSKLQEIRVKNYAGPDILLSVRFDPTTNLESLKSLMDNPGYRNYPYVDLRVENRIYYKTS